MQRKCVSVQYEVLQWEDARELIATHDKTTSEEKVHAFGNYLRGHLQLNSSVIRINETVVNLPYPLGKVQTSWCEAVSGIYLAIKHTTVTVYRKNSVTADGKTTDVYTFHRNIHRASWALAVPTGVNTVYMDLMTPFTAEGFSWALLSEEIRKRVFTCNDQCYLGVKS
jgi:hypothetical protein